MENQNFASITKPWLRLLPEGAADVELPKCSIYQFLKNSPDVIPTNIAMEYFGSKITYGQMIEKIEHYAASFTEIGVKKGDFVSIISVAMPETIFSIYALSKIGAVSNLIDPRTDPEHMMDYINKGKSEVVIAVDAIYAKIANIFQKTSAKRVIIHDPLQNIPKCMKLFAKKSKEEKSFYKSIEGDDRYLKNIDFEKKGEGKTVSDAAYEADAAAVVTRTGGTTGVAKGVILTNDNLNAVVRNVIDFGVEYAPGDRLINFLPVAASYGIACGIHVSHSMGFTCILVPKFNPANFAKLVLKHKPNHIVGVPIFYETLMSSRKAQKSDLSFMRTLVSGGDTANPTFEKRFNKFIKEHGVKYPLAQGYGMSESTSVVCFGMHKIHKDATVGLPNPHSIISVFEPGTTNELPVGAQGEVCITGATVMKEYLDEPEETANVLWKHPDGKIWIHSGDIGVMDEEGFLKIVGRSKRSIIRFDGHKVYPIQLESAAFRHKAVKNCSVIAVKDMDHEQGSWPFVVVELDPNYEIADKDGTLKEILDLIKSVSEERSHPVGIVDIDEMPMTNNSKNNILELENIYGNYNYKG